MICDGRPKSPSIAGFDPYANAGDTEYDPDAGEKVLRFFRKCLKFVRGPKAGEPFHMEPWQEDTVKILFGWRRPDGYRRFRQAFIFVPRKNGKSTWIAGIANYLLYADDEAGAECYCAASDREQASLVFGTAATMVEKAPSLLKRSRVRRSQKRIIHKDSFLRAIPANEGGSHGFDAHAIVGDELHAWPGREFFDVLQTSTGARMQPLELYITTAGYDKETVCYQQYKYAKDVRDGNRDDRTFLPVIYEADETDDWQDPEVWAKANPNLGISLNTDYIQQKYQKALAEPSFENTFRRLHLNQWTSQETRWLQMHRWRACGVSDGFNPEGPVYGGLDLSSTTDISAWVKLHKQGDGYKIIGHYFLPEGRLDELSKRDNVPYRQWEKQGWLTATPGETIDYGFIHQKVLGDVEQFDIQLIGYDPWNAEYTRKILEDINGIPMCKVRQGYGSLSEPSKKLEKAVIAGELDWSNDPVMEWMAENAEVKTDESANIKPVKPKHGSSKKIDGIVAAVMAIHAQIVAEENMPSIYNEGESLVL